MPWRPRLTAYSLGSGLLWGVPQVANAWFWEDWFKGEEILEPARAAEALQAERLQAWQNYEQPVDEAIYDDEVEVAGMTKPRLVPRTSSLSLDDYLEYFEGRMPVVLEGAYLEMPCLQEGWLEEELLNPFGKEQVVFKAKNGTHHKMMSVPLRKFVANVDKNRGEDAWAYLQDGFFFSRHPALLEDCPALPPLLQGEDQFALLPANLRPQRATLLWGGKYTRSSLHVDPYNWTGTSVVLRGEKFWRLSPPGGHDGSFDWRPVSCGTALECISYESKTDLFSGEMTDKAVPLWEAKLFPGDVLIIPSGWWHQAVNTEETVSISSRLASGSSSSWSAVAQVVKLHAKVFPNWTWGLLPEPPAGGGRKLDPEEATRLFRRFINALPADAFKAADNWTKTIAAPWTGRTGKRKGKEL